MWEEDERAGEEEAANTKLKIKTPYINIENSNFNNLAKSQKPPGLRFIGTNEGVRIYILSSRTCETYEKLICNIAFYVSGTYVMCM